MRTAAYLDFGWRAEPAAGGVFAGEAASEGEGGKASEPTQSKKLFIFHSVSRALPHKHRKVREGQKQGGRTGYR